MMMMPDPFSPHPLVRGGQLQTYAGQLLGVHPRPDPYRVIPVRLGGGDTLHLHVNEPRGGARPERPAVMLLHGLGGCSESSYVLRITRKLNALGFPSVRFNHRGCGVGGAALARAIYHAGRVEDLHAAAAEVADHFPGRRLLVAGFSLSGNMLLRYLGEAGAGIGPRLPKSVVGALAVCPPVDLEACSVALSRLENKPIDVFYTRLLRRQAEARRALFPDLKHPELPRRLDLRLFDAVYTAPLAGFESRDAYYERSSAKHVVDRIALPTLVVAAADDPIIPLGSLEAVRFGPGVRFAPQVSGGHMGFIAARKTRFGDHRWLDAAVVDWALAAAEGRSEPIAASR